MKKQIYFILVCLFTLDLFALNIHPHTILGTYPVSQVNMENRQHHFLETSVNIYADHAYFGIVSGRFPLKDKKVKMNFEIRDYYHSLSLGVGYKYELVETFFYPSLNFGISQRSIEYTLGSVANFEKKIYSTYFEANLGLNLFLSKNIDWAFLCGYHIDTGAFPDFFLVGLGVGFFL